MHFQLLPHRFNTMLCLSFFFFFFFFLWNLMRLTLKPVKFLGRTQVNPHSTISFNATVCCFHSTKGPLRSLRRSIRKRSKSNNKRTLDEAQFRLAAVSQENPLVWLELFTWASQHPRLRHDVSTYNITVKKVGAAKMYQQMNAVVNQVLAVPYIGSETIYNTIISFFFHRS